MPAAHTSLGGHVGRLGVLADSDHWLAGHPHSQTSSGFHPLYFPCLAKRGAPSPSQPALIPILYPNIIKFRSGPGHALAAATNPHCSVLISASSFNPAPSKRPPSLLVRPVWGPWPTGKVQVGSRTEVLILQPWSGLGQPPEASGAGGGTSSLMPGLPTNIAIVDGTMTLFSVPNMLQVTASQMLISLFISSA